MSYLGFIDGNRTVYPGRFILVEFVGKYSLSVSQLFQTVWPLGSASISTREACGNLCFIFSFRSSSLQSSRPGDFCFPKICIPSFFFIPKYLLPDILHPGTFASRPFCILALWHPGSFASRPLCIQATFAFRRLLHPGDFCIPALLHPGPFASRPFAPRPFCIPALLLSISDKKQFSKSSHKISRYLQKRCFARKK